jgi:hypothetical protein
LATARPSRSIERRASAPKGVVRRAEDVIDISSTGRGAEKFFARGKIFTENVLHYSNKFVQLPTSDVGFRAFRFAIE